MSSNTSINLKCVLHVFRFWLIASMILKSGDAFLLAKELPCHYYDSSDNTNGLHYHSSKNITFNALEYTPDQHCGMHYVLVNGEPVNVEQYIRGCSCAIRPCIRLCCPHGSFMKMSTEKDECHDIATVKNIRNGAIDETARTSIVDLNEYFVYFDRECSVHSHPDDLKLPKVIMGSREYFLKIGRISLWYT